LQENGRQNVEDALVVLQDKGIQKNSPRDPGPELFRHLLNNRAPEAMPHEGDIVEGVLLDVGGGGGNKVCMPDALSYCVWTAAGECRRISLMSAA